MAEENALLPLRRRSTRLVRRIDKPSRAPFLPFGLAPLGAFALLLLFGLTFFSRSIEDAVTRATHQALDSTGATWATVRVSGQWVTLEGAPPSREEAARAIAAVRDAKAGALFGQAIPVTRVSERFVWVGDLSQPGSSLGAPGLPLDPAAARPATPFPEAAVQGAAPATPAAPPAAPQVDIIIPPAPAAACDQSLSALLAEARIEFASASAELGVESADLLDSVATAAAVCPGALRIEGYTDGRGSAALNRDLSLKRAEAVRAALVQRGLSQDRLTVEGFGASRPVATNGTTEGRERNRRIEIRMASAPT